MSTGPGQRVLLFAFACGKSYLIPLTLSRLFSAFPGFFTNCELFLILQNQAK